MCLPHNICIFEEFILFTITKEAKKSKPGVNKNDVIKTRSVEDDKSYNENELEYDFYDNEDVDVNSGEVQGNYSYSEQGKKNTNKISHF